MEKHYYSKSVEQKQKFIFFPFWNMEKAEKILCEQEQNGYRFVGSRFRYFFIFQRSTPKKVQYVFTYIFPKDTWPILEWESILKSDEYRANLIQKGYCNIFRITKEDVDLRDFYMDRLRYLRLTLIKKTILSILALLLGIYTVKVGRLFSIFVSVSALIALLSYIVGFYSTIRKKKKLIQKHE